MNRVGKNNRFKKCAGVLLALLFAGPLAVAQQQTVLTNILLNQYAYNTAYAGVDSGTTFNATYRNQWVGFDGAPKTYMLSGYGNFRKRLNMTVGGSVTTERIGLFQQTSFYGTYCYKLKINKKYAINFGLGIGAVQYNVKGYDARPYDADDHFLQAPTLNAMAFDANAGFYFYSRKFFLGFSNQHMPNSKIHWDNSLGKLTPHFYAYAGYNFNFDKKWDWVLQPSVLIRTDNPSPYQLEYNLKLLYKNTVWIGVSYRDQSSINGLLGVKIDNRFTFGYSYDYTVSKLSTYQSGSHEILLSYFIPFRKKKSASEKAQEADEQELNKIDNTLKTNLRNKKKESKAKENTKEESKEENKENNASPENPQNPETPQSPPGEVKPEGSDNNSSGANTSETKEDGVKIESSKKEKPPKKYKKEKNSHYKQGDKGSIHETEK